MTAIGPLRLSTARLVLRPVEEADAVATAALVTPDVAANLSTWPSPMSETEASQRIDNSQRDLAARRAIDFAIVDRSSALLLGWIGLRLIDSGLARLGYWLGAEHRGHGLMKEAAAEAVPIGAAFLEVERVRAFVLKNNAASIAVLQAVGFRMTGEEDVFLETSRKSQSCFRFDWSSR